MLEDPETFHKQFESDSGDSMDDDAKIINCYSGESRSGYQVKSEF